MSGDHYPLWCRVGRTTTASGLTRTRDARTVSGMTINEAADALGLAASTLRLQVKLGKLKAYRMGGRIYVTTAAVADYAEHHRRPPKADA